MCVRSHFRHVQLFVTLWTENNQAPLSMGFSRQEYWSGLPCPSPGNLPNPESNPGLLHCKELQGSPCGTIWYTKFQSWLFSSVQFSCPVMSDSLQPHGLQHARPPSPSPTPRVYPNSCPSSWWRHPIILSSDVSFSSCLQSFPVSGSSPESQFFTSGGQSIEASASVLLMNIQDWFSLELSGLISLLSKGLSRILQSKGLSWWSLND